ncbi:phage holin family protein [Leeuwenhoekiella sp. MAR_2009_132]|uniref:phage holin family protein n=1 Tax=Leeuwenhoekiella sp. MAR_2009_132 TaxID=1392489 RepID=UPI00048B4017|nr:phage holin family protein [Leeuwenhoekiella sp. MAR_2009_132]
MKTLVKLILTALAVIFLGYLLPGASVTSFMTALIVAVVIALLRLIVKPILVVLTLPITVLTFGIFLLVINAVIILLADYFVSGFAVDGFWWALIFSLLLSLFQSLLFALIKEE